MMDDNTVMYVSMLFLYYMLRLMIVMIMAALCNTCMSYHDVQRMDYDGLCYYMILCLSTRLDRIKALTLILFQTINTDTLNRLE